METGVSKGRLVTSYLELIVDGADLTRLSECRSAPTYAGLRRPPALAVQAGAPRVGTVTSWPSRDHPRRDAGRSGPLSGVPCAAARARSMGGPGPFTG